MSADLCHDFKTPRTDTSKRLPPGLMLVPILFYVAVLGGGFLNVKHYLDYHHAMTERDNLKRFQAEKDQARSQFEVQQGAIETETHRAEKLAQWVEGTRTLQPLCVAVARSMPPEITLGDLSLERSLDMPSQINLEVRINNGGVQEVGRIQSAVQNLQYRPYNSQQIKNSDNLEYRSMLVWRQQ